MMEEIPPYACVSVFFFFLGVFKCEFIDEWSMQQFAKGLELNKDEIEMDLWLNF